MKKILLVDDKAENLYLLESLLTGSGYKTISAKNGIEALEILLKEPVELIISDILMPGMDGFTFCRECKKNESIKNIPFIFYTATYTSFKDEELAISLGADKFILKPQDPDVFLEIIENIIKQVKEGKIQIRNVENVPEEIVLKEYNSALIRKLEDKMAQNEEAAKELKKINTELQKEIEERKKILQDLIEAKEKAERSDKLKSEFLAQISHEIRTPVSTIISFADLLMNGYFENISEELSGILSSITTAGKRIIRTVDLILNVSEMQIGIYHPAFQKIDLIKKLSEIIRSEYSAAVKHKGLDLTFKNNLQSAVIYGDDYSINQIFVNLIDNAVKYTESGRIDVLIDRNKDNNIFVTVSDTGIGISEEFIPHIFEPFMQEDRGYSRSYEGNGLGLTLVKKYADLNGLTINLESKKCFGSNFTVTFNKNPLDKI